MNEKAPRETSALADILSDYITGGCDVTEMRDKRGASYDDTQFYQLRVKPTVKDTPLEDVLSKLEKYLKNSDSKKFGISDVEINQNSRNSGKFSSVSFSYMEKDYDLVVALGGNKGENFEKEMLLKMDNLIAGVKGEGNEQAANAFAALEKIDPVFHPGNITKVTARSGSTQRSGDMSPEETGKIIADIIIELKNGDKKYISLKNEAGATVAQFGLSKAFREDLSVATDSVEWKTWLAPFGLDPEKIEAGLHAAKDGTDLDFEDIETEHKKVGKTSHIHKIMQKMWGAGYYYLREKRTGFVAMSIDRDYVDNVLLKNLTVTEIRYPSKARKQISIYLSSDSMKFKLEVRNPRGKGSVKPTQIQLTVMKSTK